MHPKEKRIGITGFGSISPLGSSPQEVWSEYLQAGTLIRPLKRIRAWGSPLSETSEQTLSDLRIQAKAYDPLDRSVLLAMLAAERARVSAGWDQSHRAGISIGSSRGATGLLEQALEAFHQSLTGENVLPLTSPTTTLGNISSWTGRHLQMDGGPWISHSVTCSTALHAVLNGIAWLESGRCDRFLAGGAEAPLTPFTVAQMKALRLYASSGHHLYPCRALDLEKKVNTMVLGEGAACFAMERAPEKAVAWIDGVGYATEWIETATSIRPDGECLYLAMQMALEEAGNPEIDVVVCHAPGTIKGDQAEAEAIRRLFVKNIPRLTSNKWKIGHTLGASGALSLEMALLMLLHQEFVGVPYLNEKREGHRKQVRRILVNAVGFGGNAVSMVVRRAV